MTNLPVRKLLPWTAALLAGGVVAAGGAWVERLAEQRSLERVRAQVTAEVSALRARLEGELNANAYLVTGLAHYVAAHPEIDEASFRTMARKALEPDSALRHITLAPDNVITHAYPLEGNEAALGTDLAAHPEQGPSVRRVMAEKRTIVGGPVELVQGGTALIVRTPVYTNGDYWGLASVPVNLEDLYRRAGVDTARERLELAIRGYDGLGAEGATFLGDERLFYDDTVVQTVSFVGNQWQIAATPEGGWAVASALPAWRSITWAAAALGAAMITWLLTRQSLTLRASEQHFRELVQGVNGVVLRWGADGRIRFINAHGERLFGYRNGELIGRNVIGTVVPPEDTSGQDLAALMQAIQRDPEAHALNENEVMRKDGSRLWMMWSNHALRGADGRVREILSVGQDQTRRRQAELDLRRVSRQLEAIIHAIPDIGFVLDEHGLYVDVFGGQESALYHKGPHLCGRTLHEVLPPEQADGFLQQIHRAIAENRLITYEYTLAPQNVEGIDADQGPEGPQWFEARIYPLPADVHEHPAVVWLAYNITERKQAEERIRHLALHDNLTGLANRRLLQDRLHQAIELARRQQQRVALLFVDLDHFKPVNDRHGHAFGDQVLCEMARRLERLVRGSDTVARLGGDEFVLLLQHITTARDAEAVAHKVVATASQPVVVDGIECRLSASVGISLYPDHGTEPDTLLRLADQSMYVVKQGERGEFRLAAPM
ncbi:diguanylate cyclase domain-containing protein [Alkalilimnicola ehrlichii]|uniref:diguanylate cyclase domain-containing protein n=1 Tax=Alkalilimnicola ehrlichii TaxID=351052 RepID=UPI003BA04C43